MKIKKLLIFFICLLFLFSVSCSGRRGSPPEQGKEDEKQGGKGYIVYINADSPEKDVLYRSDIDGKNKEKIIEKGTPLGAAISDGKLALVLQKEGKKGLHIISADGKSDTTVLSDFDIKPDSLTWSPDGQKIAFSGKDKSDKVYQIYYVEAGKYRTPVKVSDEDVQGMSPGFSKDGKFILYVNNYNNNYDILKYDMGSRENTNISQNTANDMSPVVSTDGTKVFFLSDEYTKGRFNLYSTDIDGRDRERLTDDLNIYVNSLKVSPDNSMVAFINQNNKGNKRVQVMDMNRAAVMIANDAYLSSWSNDGEKLYYTTSDEKNRKIMEYDVTGKTMKDIIKIEYKPGEEASGIKFLDFTDKLK